MQKPTRSCLGPTLGIMLLIVVVVIGVLAFAGPRTRDIFGSVYNSLGGENYRAQPAGVPVTVPPLVVTMPPAMQPTVSIGQGASGSFAPIVERMVIKNADLSLQVEDADAAARRLAGIVLEAGGYVISTNTWSYDEYKQGQVVLAVPSDKFEAVLEQIRAIATRVEQESITGQDVTEEYVDLNSRQRNLEATQTRLRTLLDKAATVEEAVDVSRELSNVEEQLEVIKGRMQYLEGRTAYSTISVRLTPPRAVPKPGEWKAGDTFQQARQDLVSALRSVADALIWVGVVLLPLVGAPGLVLVGIVWTVRRRKRQKGGAADRQEG